VLARGMKWAFLDFDLRSCFPTMIPQVDERDEIDFSKNDQQSLDWDDIIQLNEV